MASTPSSPDLIWGFNHFDKLKVTALYAILRGRSQVFVVEQNCVYLDMDNCDQNCYHLSAWNQDGQLAAYLRVVPPGLKFVEASLGRVISTESSRGTGAGKELLKRGIQACQDLYPNTAIRIGAQYYLESFYRSFGFQTVSDIYLEDDIQHVEMILG